MWRQSTSVAFPDTLLWLKQFASIPKNSVVAVGAMGDANGTEMKLEANAGGNAR
jgi:hypothetical protein